MSSHSIQTIIDQLRAAADRGGEKPDWLDGLDARDAELVWTRARRTRWKPICLRFDMSRATAHRRWRQALSVIAAHLNGQHSSAKRPWRRRSFATER